MKRIATLLLVAAACGGSPLSADGSDLSTVALGPQSFVHGALSPSQPQRWFTFRGQAGDVIAPDVWPTASVALAPTLALFGPGRLAVGAPRGADPRHVAIDGFRLPRTGTYRLLVGLAPKSAGGMFTLRLWMQSSHLPRQESSQVDLALTPGPVAAEALRQQAESPHPWTDAEVDGVIAELLQEKDARVALSSAQYLLSGLASGQATDGQRTRARTAAAQVVGTPRRFRSLSPAVQAFALWWLGDLLFSPAPQEAPASVAETVAQLVAAWPGAQEDKAARAVRGRALNGAVYGWQADFRASQADLDGTPVWIDFAREWFDGAGHWLGEESAGASEPEDD